VLSNDQDNRKRFSIRGKDIEEKHLAFTTAGGPSQWKCEGEIGEVQKTEQRQEIVNLLQKEGRTMGHQEIKQRLKDVESSISQNSVHIILRKMLKEGVLEQPKYGQYCLAGQRSKVVDFGIAKRMRRTRWSQ